MDAGNAQTEGCLGWKGKGQVTEGVLKDAQLDGVPPSSKLNIN